MLLFAYLNDSGDFFRLSVDKLEESKHLQSEF